LQAFQIDAIRDHHWGEEWSPRFITLGADSVTEGLLKRTIPVGFAIFWIAALVSFIGPGQSPRTRFVAEWKELITAQTQVAIHGDA